jgi:hypothetical protein
MDDKDFNAQRAVNRVTIGYKQASDRNMHRTTARRILRSRQNTDNGPAMGFIHYITWFTRLSPQKANQGGSRSCLTEARGLGSVFDGRDSTHHAAGDISGQWHIHGTTYNVFF